MGHNRPLKIRNFLTFSIRYRRRFTMKASPCTLYKILLYYYNCTTGHMPAANRCRAPVLRWYLPTYNNIILTVYKIIYSQIIGWHVLIYIYILGKLSILYLAPSFRFDRRLRETSLAAATLHTAHKTAILYYIVILLLVLLLLLLYSQLLPMSQVPPCVQILDAALQPQSIL